MYNFEQFGLPFSNSSSICSYHEAGLLANLIKDSRPVLRDFDMEHFSELACNPMGRGGGGVLCYSIIRGCTSVFGGFWDEKSRNGMYFLKKYSRLRFARSSGNALDCHKHQYCYCYVVKTLVGDHIQILGLGLKILSIL